MKRIILLVLILGLTSVSQAAVIGFYIDGAKEYAPTAGEVVNIELIADEACSSIDISAIVEGNAAIATEVLDMGGELLSITFHPGFSIIGPGWIDNYQGVLLDTLNAYAVPAIAAGEVLLTLEYQLSDTWDGVTDYWISPPVEAIHLFIAPGEFFWPLPSYGILDGDEVLITGVHLIPEACVCYGDVSGDDKITAVDLAIIAGWLNAYGVPMPRIVTIPGDSEYFDPCADVNFDGVITPADLSVIAGWLNAYGVMINRIRTILCPHPYAD